jgi:hypothetical protein
MSQGVGSRSGSSHASWTSEEEAARGEARADQQQAAGVGLAGSADEEPAWRRSFAAREGDSSCPVTQGSSHHQVTDSGGGDDDADDADDDPELTASTAHAAVPRQALRCAAHETALVAAGVPAAALQALVCAAADGNGDQGVGGTSVGALLAAAALPDKELSLLLGGVSGPGSDSGGRNLGRSAFGGSSGGAHAKLSKKIVHKPASKKIGALFRGAVSKLPVQSYSVELRSPGGAGGKFVVVHGETSMQGIFVFLLKYNKRR